MDKFSGHAIVYGASGLIGWAVVNQLLSSYPGSGAFSKVTAVTNRLLDPSETFWPEQQPGRPDLQLVSGVDLRDGDGSTLAESLKGAVPDIESVTNIFYLVFNAVGGDDIKEVATNLHMFRNVIDAHGLLSPNLQFVAFPGGTRGYGIYVPGGTFTPPLTEDMVNHLPPDYAKTVVYISYRELLNSASQGKKWTWCEVCPDAIIGFTPNGSQFSLALHWAQYLSLYAHNHGLSPAADKPASTAVEVPFPGNSASATSLFTPAAARTIARFMIYASLHPETCGGGQLFNIADSETPCKYGEIWPQLAKWFGLVGTGPADSSKAENNTLKVGQVSQSSSVLTPGEYLSKYKDVFVQSGLEKAASGGVGAGSRQLDSVGYWLTFDRQMSIKRLRDTGFEGDSDPILGWLESFEMFRKAGIIF
ncbi:hypothetical protein BJ166DRAFT_561117 [Pestalotiopsis sp. NC0098]|nr:hypothetical protein BJ166DRAFT_561117 [Pestalotiopsis sp. NC0098]